MAVARFGMIQTTGPALAVAIVVALAAGLTLAPALLVLFGPALFWPRHPKPIDHRGRDRRLGSHRRGHRPAAAPRRPWWSSVRWPSRSSSCRARAPTSTPSPSCPRRPTRGQGFDAVASHMDKGRLMPVSVFVEVAGVRSHVPVRAGDDRGARRPARRRGGRGQRPEPRRADGRGDTGRAASLAEAARAGDRRSARSGPTRWPSTSCWPTRRSWRSSTAGLGWLQLAARDVPAIRRRRRLGRGAGRPRDVRHRRSSVSRAAGSARPRPPRRRPRRRPPLGGRLRPLHELGARPGGGSRARPVPAGRTDR